MSPLRDEQEPAELITEARQKLEELRALAAENLGLARAQLASGAPLDRAAHRALNKAASLARYVADCAQRAAWEPPRRKQTGGFGWENWRTPPSQDALEVRVVEVRLADPSGYMPEVEALVAPGSGGAQSVLIDVRNPSNTAVAARVILELPEGVRIVQGRHRAAVASAPSARIEGR